MSALSTKDKLRLRLSRERVERWERERRKPVWTDPDTGKQRPRCQGILFVPNQDKLEEVIKPDAVESIHRATDGYQIRTSSAKLSLAEKGAGKGLQADACDPVIIRDPESAYKARACVKPRKGRVKRDPAYFAALSAKVQIVRKGG